MFKYFFVFIALASSGGFVKTARILAIIPTASYSHQMFYQQFWRELAIRGHDIVVITTDPTGENLPNFKEVSIRETYPLMKEIVNTLVKGDFLTILSINDMIFDTAEFQLNLPQVQEIINNRTEHFDLLFVEHFMPIFFGFKHRFDCSMIGVTSIDAFAASHHAMGNPTHPILYPVSIVPFQENLTFFQRLIVFGYSHLMEFIRFRYNHRTNKLLKKTFGEDAPDADDLFDMTDMLFVNANPLITAVRPHTPSTISIAGGIHMKPPKPLPKELQDFLDGASEGVVYFSMGSNVKSKELTPETRSTIMNTFAQLPYQFLWKFEDDQLPGKPDNVKIIKWAPQQDILRHKHVKLFVTQAGLQSLEEALYSHVPMVTIPFFGDQAANAQKVAAKDMGVVLDKDKLSVDEFKAAILEVIENPKYKNNIVQLASRIQDEPMSPLGKAVWWAEYVLRHKHPIQLKGPKIPFYQYYYFDILAFLVLTLILVALVFALIAKSVAFMVKCLLCKQTKLKAS